MREYEKSHPWIDFTLDIRRFSHHLWLALGEIQSKCEHVAHMPLDDDTRIELYQVYLAKGIGATTAIEGNTLTENQVREQLNGKLELPPSQEYLAKEVQNVIEALDVFDGELQAMPKGSSPPPFTPDDVCIYNFGVLHDLDHLDEKVVPGEIRKHSVGVGRYRGAPAKDCEHLLERLCTWLGSGEFGDISANRIVSGLVKAVVAHLYIAWIHPFADGNGRTARLLEFRILLESGVPSPSAHLLSNHYNKTRTAYYQYLDRASKVERDVKVGVYDFLEYSLIGMVDGLREQVFLIQEAQVKVMWENHVHRAFRELPDTKTNRRRRRLALAISESDEAVELYTLLISWPELIGDYRGVSPKTIKRDINELVRLGLIEVVARGLVVANKSIIQGMVPPRLDT